MNWLEKAKNNSIKSTKINPEFTISNTTAIHLVILSQKNGNSKFESKILPELEKIKKLNIYTLTDGDHPNNDKDYPTTKPIKGEFVRLLDNLTEV